MARRGQYSPAADNAELLQHPCDVRKLPNGLPETARNQLAATLRRDADGLIAITATD